MICSLSLKRGYLVAAVASCCLAWLPATCMAAEKQADQAARRPLFAFDNGVGRGDLSPEKQAALLKELGYDGICYTGLGDLPARLKAFDQQGLKIYAYYVGVVLGPEGPKYDENLEQGIEALRGRDSILWLFIRGKAPDVEDQAVLAAGKVADMAAKARLRVALYPHKGFHVQRVEDALRIVRKANRPNLGASFNLCHWLAVDGTALKQRLREAAPKLYLVSINGADAGQTTTMGWDRLIQTLDRGDYDVGRVLRTLDEVGYQGPVGLQCYNIPGEPRENLARSMAAWRALTKAPQRAASSQ